MDQTPPGDDLRPEDELQPSPEQPIPEPPAPPPAEPPAMPPAWPPLASEPEPEAEPPVQDEASDDDFADIWRDDWEPGPGVPVTVPRRRRPVGAIVTGILIVVLGLGALAATGWAVMQVRQRALVENAAQQALALIGDGAPEQLRNEVHAINGLLLSQPDEAARRLAAIRSALPPKTPEGQTPAAGATEPIPQSAYDDLPADAATFFRGHEDLFRRFLMMCAQARELKGRGVNVDELRVVRDSIIESARLGQLEAVQTKMVKMMGMLQGQGGGQGQAGGPQGPLAIKAQRLKLAVQRAEQQGRDIRGVIPFMRQAEQAAQAGKLAEAEKLLDQAMDAVRRAPRGGRRMADGRRGFFVGGRAPRTANPLAPFVQALLGVMGAEEENLKVVTNELLQMHAFLVGEPPATSPPPAEAEPLKPMVDRALSELQTMSVRRQELARHMGQQPGGKPVANRPRPDRLTPEERQNRTTIILERLTPILDRLRAMSDTEYQQLNKRVLVREIVQAVLAPPPPVTPKPPVPTDQEERIRTRMMQASLVLKQWELEGKDTTEVEKLFAAARKALYAKQLDDSEKLVDEARQLLGMDPRPEDQPAPSAGAAGGRRPALPDSGDDALKLDLRGGKR